MYTTAFILGFFTSFGWWSAAKIQRLLDAPLAPAAVAENTDQQKLEVDSKK